jgi:formylglycine-generating enzyme required for sulfatase activity
MRRLIIPSALLILGFLATYLVTTRARRAEPGPSAPASGASSARRSPAVARPPGMVWVPGGEFTMGSGDPEAGRNERPAHRVRVDGFWMDVTEVTNAQFRRFVEATGYLTTADRPVAWGQLRKELPPGTPKPPDDRLAPGSLVFNPPGRPVSLDDPPAW